MKSSCRVFRLISMQSTDNEIQDVKEVMAAELDSQGSLYICKNNADGKQPKVI